MKNKPKIPSVKIMDSGDGVAILTERLRSNEWWLIVMASKAGCKLGGLIEERFYRGKANADFELLMIPGAATKQDGAPILFGLALAHKRRMSHGDLLMMIQGHMGHATGEPDSDMVITQDAPVSVVEWLISLPNADRSKPNG